MDSSVFIRNRRVLVMWLAVPLLAVAVAEIGSRTFCNVQQESYQRKKALDGLIPEMTAAGERFDRFISGYTLGTAGSSSIEDTYIELLNTAADMAKFKITSIKLVQERDGKSNTIKVVANVSGKGSYRSIVAFLNFSKKKDPLIYEERIDLSGSGENRDLLQLAAQLGRIYIGNEGARP